MLSELRIENFAIIDQLEIHFEAGLVIFTGETGAGKSILIDAVETLLGGRADATLIRSGAERAVVEGIFRLAIPTRDEITALLKREDLLDDQDTLSLSREIRTTGRNIARINGHLTSASMLRSVGELLVDVHGQSEHLSLLRVNQHLRLLDNYAGVTSLLSEYQQTYNTWLATGRELESIRKSEQDTARLIDTLNYQVNEIESARLHPDEEGQLRSERNRLANAESLASFAQQVLVLIDEGSPETPAATDLLGQAVEALSGLARLDQSQAGIHGRAASIFDNLEDLVREIRDYLEQIEFNPRRLDQVEERLGLIQNLKRKYGDTIPLILDYRNKAHNQLESINHATERIQELEEQLARFLLELGQQGELLSQKRHLAADKLSTAIEKELRDLSMPRARFQVDFQMRPDPQGTLLSDGRRVAFDSNGLERIEFLIAPNPGEGFKPLVKIASGGETSRLMLGLKNVLIQADQVPILIFDEIDQGIGGRVGSIVGNKLWQLALKHQVLCVTHLPQLAAYGHEHFSVQKELHNNRTITRVQQLSGENRVQELAQMIGGVGAGARQTAQELLQAVATETRQSA